MESMMKEFEHLEIQMDEISLATNNFDSEKVIGSGGFGKVYEGKMTHSKGQTMVAIKRLNRQFGQGDPEFWKEIVMLSRYTHENLISLVGFCYKGNEKILVYEHAFNRSLDRHLSSSHLTWTQRIKICLDAAKGLNFLHDGKVAHQRVLHRDIKSANILLDENWNAKVADMGLSKIGPANQDNTGLVTNIVGTPGYCDPQYMNTYTLTKESDTYSFGVVLFEVLCGRLCYEYTNDHLIVLVNRWKKCFKEKKLNEIMFQDLAVPMNPLCLKEFADISFQCLLNSREKRPKMSLVVEKLKIALNMQRISEAMRTQVDYPSIARTAVPPLCYGSEEELRILLSSGVVLYEDKNKTWFSRNDNGEHCTMIFIEDPFRPFSELYRANYEVLKTRLKTQLLSPLTTYTVNLVYKIRDNDNEENRSEYLYSSLEYKLESETEYFVAYLAVKREDGRYVTELYQFTCHRNIVDLEITFEVPWTWLKIEGIEFQPLDKMEHQVLEDDEKVDMLSISNSDDTYWEQKLPDDYQHIINCSKDVLQWTTKKQLYSILRKGILLNDGDEWFSLDKNGKKCQMLSANATCVLAEFKPRSFLHKSRFEDVLEFSGHSNYEFYTEIITQVLSPETTYATYLVYKLPEDQSRFEAPLDANYIELDSAGCTEVVYSRFIYLVSPQTPVIKGKVDENTHTPSSRSKLGYIPQQRSDGWMEVQIWKFETDTTSEIIPMRVELVCPDIYPATRLHGLCIQGIEFRPI